MNEDDFQLVLRAKRQIQREAALRSFLVAGVAVAAALRFADIDLPFMYPLLFTVLFVFRLPFRCNPSALLGTAPAPLVGVGALDPTIGVVAWE